MAAVAAFRSMKPVLLAAAFVLRRWAFADQTAVDETADRAAIESIIATLNSHRKPVASLFTLEAPTADVQELTRLAEAPENHYRRSPSHTLSSARSGS